MNPAPVFFVVDRFEGDMAVLIGDDDHRFDVPRAQLPRGTREGVVLRVKYDSSGTPDWTTAEPDEPERKRRLRALKQTVDELRKRDPGGDVKL